jgi:Ca2+-binding EF-hand superfamily protein
VKVDEKELKKWIRENDRSNKGFIDWNDYKYIYTPASRQAKGKSATPSPTPSSSQRVNRVTLTSSTTLSADHNATTNDVTSVSIQHADLYRKRESERQQLLWEAFSKYDLDGDGLITVEDMRLSLGSQRCSDAEIARWIEQRDASGLGAVSFPDFVKHYGKKEGRATPRLGTFRTLASSLGRFPSTGNEEEEEENKGNDDDIEAAARADRQSAPRSRLFSSGSERTGGRIELLREAFANYDLDGDGLISREDMRLAVSDQQCSDAQIEKWIQRRDSTGRGAVSFEDFIKHYR